MSEYETRAVTTIQTHFRGYLARKQYSKMLLTLFEEEEEKRREKERIQILEGEILLEKYRLRNRIAENITINQNEERLTNMMATRIQRAWKKYQVGRVQTHPQLKGQGNNAVLNNCKQFKTGAQDNARSYKQSSSQLHLKSSPSNNDVKSSDTQPMTIPQDAMPTNEFEVSTDLPHKQLLTSSGPMSQTSKCYASTEQELSRRKLNSVSVHPVQHFGHENTFKNGSNHYMVQLPTSVKSLEDKPPTVNKGVKSLDDRYRLCYTTELSDSSADEDRNWLAVPEEGTFPDTACAAGGNNDTHCELDDFVSDNDPIHLHTIETSPNRQANCEKFSPKEWKVLDHSTSPLHAMTLQQLRQLFLSLEQQLSDHSRTLIELLVEKDWLMNENELLKTNIAHLARRAQSLYQAP